jgi:hypothetical protein
MPKDNPHYPKDETARVVLNYDKKSGAITDRFGTLICAWNELNHIPIQAAKPTIPLPVRQSPLGDIIRLKEAGFTALEIIALKNSNTY